MADETRRFEAKLDETTSKWIVIDNHNGRRSVLGRGELAQSAAEKYADELEASHRAAAGVAK